MSKSTRNIAASVRQRLLNLARDRNEEYNALLVQFAIERFLYRLSRSAVAERFVLKGAMLFRVWTSDLHRPTRDLDLFGRGEATPEAVAESVRQIIATRVDDDGMSFDPDSITAEEIRDTQEYGGIRVRLDAHLGDLRIVIQVDVGFGDAIVPGPERKTFPTLLDHAAAELAIYPPESVVAEKLQAITVLGIANSRMKDYYDLLVIGRRFEFEGESLAAAIKATFARRNTPLPAEPPTGLSDALGADAGKQQQWGAFLQRLRIEDAPNELQAVLAKIRRFVVPALDMASKRSDVIGEWRNGGPWSEGADVT